MRKAIQIGFFVVTLGASGCAHIDFGGDGLTYYDPKPYLFVSTTKECVTTATVVIIPEKQKSMKFISGYGSSDLSATLSNGMIVEVGQKTDSQIPDTIRSIASLGTAAAALRTSATTGKDSACAPAAKLYPVVDGVPDLKHPLDFPVSKPAAGSGGVDQ